MEAQAAAVPGRRLEPGRVLVVEDDSDHLAIAVETLEEAGYHVEGARDGCAALDLLLQSPLPDVILLDLCLPTMDGWQLVSELRARPALCAIPVVAMTGAGERVLNSAPVSAGYLAKPLDRHRLLETIAVCLARKHHVPSGSDPSSGS